MTIIEDLQTDEPGPRIHLYEIDFTTALRYDASGPSTVNIVNGPQDETFDSVVYSAETSFQFIPAAFRLNEIPEPNIIIFGQWNPLLDALNAYDSILGAKLTRIFTLLHYLDGEASADTTQKYEEIWFFDQLVSRTKNAVKYKLSPALGLKQKLSAQVLPRASRRGFTI